MESIVWQQSLWKISTNEYQLHVQCQINAKQQYLSSYVSVISLPCHNCTIYGLQRSASVFSLYFLHSSCLIWKATSLQLVSFYSSCTRSTIFSFFLCPDNFTNFRCLYSSHPWYLFTWIVYNTSSKSSEYINYIYEIGPI